MELFFTIKKDAEKNEYSRILLKEIKKFSNNNIKTKYERGDVSRKALLNMLNVIKNEENKIIKTYSYSGILEQLIHQYLETKEGFHIGIKVK